MQNAFIKAYRKPLTTFQQINNFFIVLFHDKFMTIFFLHFITNMHYNENIKNIVSYDIYIHICRYICSMLHIYY